MHASRRIAVTPLQHLVNILLPWAVTFAGVALFGAVGAGVASFLPRPHAVWLSAPLIGIALWPLATLALYVALPPASQLSFDIAAKAAFGVLIILLNAALVWRNGTRPSHPSGRSW